MDSKPAVEASGLVKRYAAANVVDGVSFSVPVGSVLGLLGPNGAGKTTVVRMLSTLVRPDGGAANICGFDVVADATRVRRMIGLTGQSTSVDGDLSGEQNLMMIGRLLGLSRRTARRRARAALAEAGLAESARTQAKAYSGGMRRRLDLAMSMLAEPAVLFLDEPTTGLDPARRGETWSMIRRLADEGAAVLLTTQYLEEADQLADQIVVLAEGRVIAEGTAESLKRRLGTQTLEIRLAHLADLTIAAQTITAHLGTVPATDVQTRMLSAAVANRDAMIAIVRALDDAGVAIDELQLRLPSLDEVFLGLTGPQAARTHEPEGRDR